MFQYVLLFSIYQLKGERTYSAIYHTLKGKKSSQTFQDIYAYGLTSYFGILRSIDREKLQQEIEILSEKGYINKEEDYLSLTKKGYSYIENPPNKVKASWLNGLTYHHVGQIFWSRFLLFVQTSTNIAAGKNQFIPVDDRKDILQWVKRKYQSEKHDLMDYITGIYNEISSIFSELPDWLAELITLRITAHHRYGWSRDQLAYRYSLSNMDVDLYIISVTHFILDKVTEDKSTFPRLYSFCDDLFKALPLTQSAEKTLEWLHKGQSIDTISKIRNLKISTIQDHIVEIALVDPAFELSAFISERAVNDISQQASKLNTNRLKVIKEALRNEYSYFQIRLVLAALKKEEISNGASGK